MRAHQQVDEEPEAGVLAIPPKGANEDAHMLEVPPKGLKFVIWKMDVKL